VAQLVWRLVAQRVVSTVRRRGWRLRGVGLALGCGLTLRQADGCAGGARAIVGWVGAAAAYAGRYAALLSKVGCATKTSVFSYIEEM